MKNDLKKWISLLLVLGWMVLIFCLSAQNADQSSGLRGGVLRFLLKCFGITDSDRILQISSVLHLLIRKGGHFTEYLILAVLLTVFFLLLGFSAARQSLFSVTISLLYAVSDEIHQLFVPGRFGAVKDVLIDCSGALFGILLVMLWKKLRLRKKQEKILDNRPDI